MPKRTISGSSYFEGEGHFEGPILVFAGQGRAHLDDESEEGHNQMAKVHAMIDPATGNVYGAMTLNCLHGVIGIACTGKNSDLVLGSGYWVGATGKGTFTATIEGQGVRADYSMEITTKA